MKKLTLWLIVGDVTPGTFPFVVEIGGDFLFTSVIVTRRVGNLISGKGDHGKGVVIQFRFFALVLIV